MDDSEAYVKLTQLYPGNKDDDVPWMMDINNVIHLH